MIELLLNKTHIKPPEEVMFTLAGTYEMTVPEGATTMSAVAVGGGQSASSTLLQHTGGEGGSLRYRNAIPVTPGEKMTVVVSYVLSGGQVEATQIKLQRVKQYPNRSVVFTPGLGVGVACPVMPLFYNIKKKTA